MSIPWKPIPYKPSDAWMFTPELEQPVFTYNEFPSFETTNEPSKRRGKKNKKANRTAKQPVSTDIPVPKQTTVADRCEAKPTIDTTVHTAHPCSLLADIRSVVTNYRMISVSHFATDIGVQLANNFEHNQVEPNPAFRLQVIFSNYGKTISRTCRWFFRKGRATSEVTIREKGRWLPLPKSLAMHFPPSEEFVYEDALKQYWASNGKTFNWTGLPTELKDNVIQFCVSSPTSYEDGFNDVPATKRQTARAYLDNPRARCELVQKLGDWKFLLLVSTQVRAITLRLLFTGSNTYPNGFCISSDNYLRFGRRLHRLDKSHQTLDSDSVVSAGRRSSVLASQYRKFPKVYPELQRFATFKHGIRKVHLHFDFLSYLYFFKVTVDDIDRRRPEGYATSDVFEQLPHLNEIVVGLPTSYDRYQGLYGPLLFHDRDPCPRILHRLIYEKVAADLAHHNEVGVRLFIDEDEERRFRDLRESARLALKFTEEELRELYADDGGGIVLEGDELDSGDDISQTSTIVALPSFDIKDPAEAFFPPRCACDYPCDRIFRGDDQFDSD
ncbi:hypothetical protein K458DRAFT_381479 [Lentithecium fluviatile CBS 122367]|uniref:Uncharacterized protein n=1 Tax=Lentithecium fluviatile CBS 122367 TaxID=1168545 RepID=A0A6G1JN97_9PLEO|nr:hypothetical protein K458DRAFT_381479 [Lentithecium fluviatile CBS 122367]